MKTPIASMAAMLAAVCLFVAAACSPPQSPIRPPIDPWKAATERPVPPGPVGDAQRFLLNAPAYQFTTEWENLDTHQKAHEEGRVVRNEGAWIESVGLHGKEGIITDGKREFVFFQGRYEQEPGDAVATLADHLKNASLQFLLDVSEERAPLLGSEKVDGVEAEIFALNTLRDNTGGLLSTAPPQGTKHLRVWIAKENHRPLKVEVKEEYADQQKPGVFHATTQIRTYRYDPNIKVTLPSS